MTNAQTEARAIVRWTRDAAGWVEWPDGEWVRYSDHTTALAAKDAELAEVQAERDAAREYAMQARLREKAAEDARVSAVSRASRTEVALAETRKALEEAREVVDACAGDNRPAREWALAVRDGIDAALATRRAREGGKVDG